jgi:hypothetical protein
MPRPLNSPIGWAYLNRYAYMGVQDERIVAVAYWTPPAVGMETDTERPETAPEPVIMESGYYLTRTDDPQGKWFASGSEPTGKWPEELLWKVGRRWREWVLDWENEE